MIFGLIWISIGILVYEHELKADWNDSE